MTVWQCFGLQSTYLMQISGKLLCLALAFFLECCNQGPNGPIPGPGAHSGPIGALGHIRASFGPGAHLDPFVPWGPFRRALSVPIGPIGPVVTFLPYWPFHQLIILEMPPRRKLPDELSSANASPIPLHPGAHYIAIAAMQLRGCHVVWRRSEKHRGTGTALGSKPSAKSALIAALIAETDLAVQQRRNSDTIEPTDEDNWLTNFSEQMRVCH